MSQDTHPYPGAFMGSAAVQSEVITRLQRGLAGGLLMPHDDHEWDVEAGRGSITGLCSRAQQRDGYERALGWPYLLGATHESLLRATQQVHWPDAPSDGEPPQPSVELDAELLPAATRWLVAIRPGQDLRWALGTFQRRLVEALATGLPLLSPLTPALHAALAEWQRLLKPAQGAAPHSAAWQALRDRARALAAQTQGAERTVATLVEAGAWPQDADGVDWLPAWREFVNESVRVRLDEALSPGTATLLRAHDQAWEALKKRSEAEPLLDMFEAAEQDPAMQAIHEPEVQRELETTQRAHARPLLLALLALFESSVAEPAAPAGSAAAPATPAPAPAAAATIVQISSGEHFQSEVLECSLPVLVDFWAPWCGPCVQFMPVLDRLAADYAGRVHFVKVNIDEQEALGQQFNIRALPSLLVFKGGQAVERVMALNRGRIEAVLNQHIQQG